MPLATEGYGLSMEIDLFCELASPSMRSHHASHIYGDLFAVAGAADRLGFGAPWLPEHHFLGDYSAAAAPDMLLAAIARETTRLQLGFAILPLPIHDPVRVAERLTTLNIISGGRVLWGVGRGVTITELEAFGVEPEDSRKVFKERLAELRDILESGRYRRGSQTYDLNPPPALRLRHGWMAAVSPESFDLAATLELDVLTGPFKPSPIIKVDLKRYRRLRPDGISVDVL
ncbi:MAG: LLM class flavin-dependent oxidoreductase [Rhodospirillales bacterium]